MTYIPRGSDQQGRRTTGVFVTSVRSKPILTWLRNALISFVRSFRNKEFHHE